MYSFVGSLKPFDLSLSTEFLPGNVPITTGSCIVCESVKKPITQEPGVRNEGVSPKPFIDGVVTGIITDAQGRSSVGILDLSSV